MNKRDTEEINKNIQEVYHQSLEALNLQQKLKNFHQFFDYKALKLKIKKVNKF